MKACGKLRKSTQARRRVELYHIFFNPNLCTPLWNSLAHCHILELLVNDFQCSQEKRVIRKASLIVEIEECFNIEIPDEYLVTELFENDEHMIDIIEQLIKK